MKSKANKLPLETKAELAYDNMILMLKPGYQTLVTPFSTDNRRYHPTYIDKLNSMLTLTDSLTSTNSNTE